MHTGNTGDNVWHLEGVLRLSTQPEKSTVPYEDVLAN